MSLVYDNTEEVLTHKSSVSKVVIERKFGHPFLQCSCNLQCFFLVSELFHFHLRFGCPSAEKLYNLLQPARPSELSSGKWVPGINQQNMSTLPVWYSETTNNSITQFSLISRHGRVSRSHILLMSQLPIRQRPGCFQLHLQVFGTDRLRSRTFRPRYHWCCRWADIKCISYWRWDLSNWIQICFSWSWLHEKCSWTISKPNATRILNHSAIRSFCGLGECASSRC